MKKKIFVIILPFLIIGFCILISHGFLAGISAIHFMCPFRVILGIYCPGCGCTRAVHFLLRLDIISSVRSNPSILLMCIAIAMWYAELVFKTFGKDIKLFPRNRNFYFVIAVLLLIFYIARNFITVLEPSWNY